MNRENTTVHSEMDRRSARVTPRLEDSMMTMRDTAATMALPARPKAVKRISDTVFARRWTPWFSLLLEEDREREA